MGSSAAGCGSMSSPSTRTGLQHQVRPDAEEGRLPQHQVGQLARLHRTDLGVEPVRHGRPDGVLGDVAPGAHVVGPIISPAVTRQRAAALLHHVRRLPGPDDRLADPSHGLGVRADHRDRAQVVQDVLGRHGRGPDARGGEGQVLRDRRVQVMADHQHVEVLVERVTRVRAGRVGRGRQHVRVRGDLDDVRGVTALVPCPAEFGPDL